MYTYIPIDTSSLLYFQTNNITFKLSVHIGIDNNFLPHFIQEYVQTVNNNKITLLLVY